MIQHNPSQAMQQRSIPKIIRKRDGKKTRFDVGKAKTAIAKAVDAAGLSESERGPVTETIFGRLVEHVSSSGRNETSVAEVENYIVQSMGETGYQHVGRVFTAYRDKRAHVRDTMEIITGSKRSTTDAALLIASDSKDTIGLWNTERIVHQLEEEAGLAPDLARSVAKSAEGMVVDLYDRNVRRLTTTQIRGIVDMALGSEGLDSVRRKQALLGIPTRDLEDLIISQNHENSNVSANNPEAVNLGIAETVLKQFALENVFSPEVAEAHLKGQIHLHDLGYIPRVYCSAHSIEFLKKYGLDKALPNLESKSRPPNSAAVLNQHVQTFLASKQADYAGALGFGFLNILYSSLLDRPVDVVRGRVNGAPVSFEEKDLEKLVEQGILTIDETKKGKSNYFDKIDTRKEMRDSTQREYDQTAQNLVFAGSQNAFSRGGQTLFIDFNIHTGVPSYMRNVPAIGPGGKYIVKMPDGHVEMIESVPRFRNNDDPDDKRNGDADDSQLSEKLQGGHIVTYGDLEPSAQRFAKSLLKVYETGDKDGRPFHFPKCDLHVDSNSFADPKQAELLDQAFDVSSKNGSVYFMFDRGSDAVLAQCCRLREKVEDKSMLKYPEKLRFVGFQNVTVNLPRAALQAQERAKQMKCSLLEATLAEVDSAMDLALQAHIQKKDFIQKLLDTDGSPLRGAGKPSDDGEPYINLAKATYIVGLIGANEAAQLITGKQLHESEESYRVGLEIVAHMYRKTQEMRQKTGLKFTLEETPAESTTRRLAKVDMNDKEYGADARKVIKGTTEDPYYTNSIHFAPDADVGLVDRLVGQSRFHDMIASGAIVHAWLGEHRPDKNVIGGWVRNALENTRCSQFVVSPTYTECDACGNVMVGDKELCTRNSCTNADETTVDHATISAVTRVVGYNSRVSHWNESQRQIFEDRKKAEELYAGAGGRDMGWMYNPNGHDKLTVIQFGKTGCPTCEDTKGHIAKQMERLGLDGNVEFRVHYLDDPNNRRGLVEAAMYDVPLDTVPTVVIAGRDGHWKKTTQYASKADVPYCPTGACGIDSAANKPRNILITPSDIRGALSEHAQSYGIALKPQE